ncbi:MAG: PilZ domain-containing protein [Spirochaeta sp.]|nr:PilZ domain-containing protein [Spirochaeta sp.]
MERRKNVRTDFVMHGWVDFGDDVVDCTVLDLSLRGCMLRLSTIPDQGINPDVVVHLKLAEEITIESTASIVATHGSECRLEFRVMDVDSLAHLRRLMELNTADEEEITKELHELPAKHDTHHNTKSE